jgi:hypothetical protein
MFVSRHLYTKCRLDKWIDTWWKCITGSSTVVGSVKVKLNAGDTPTIEFLPAAIDGNDPNTPK